MKLNKAFLKLILVIAMLLSGKVFGQLPNDLSNVKANQISNEQLSEFVQKAASSGLSESQILQELSKRGLATSEIEILKGRLAKLSASNTTNAVSNTQSSSRVQINHSSIHPPSNVSSIFGSELFSTPNLSFEPDLRIPTPKNYLLGPDDQIELNVYGVNLSQQTLKVNPEGTVYLKYAGPIQVSGLTIEEATRVITKKLTKYYPAIKTGGTKVQLALTGIRTIKIMVIGAVKKPGSYNLSSLATLFNALYVSGGPQDNGSFRQIELIRDNKLFLVADLYDFLIAANQKSNVRLFDNDIIRIPFVKNKIQITGEVNREGFYEVLKNETLSTIIDYAGGFKTNAYKKRITGTRVSLWDKQIIDILGDSINKFYPNDGDVYIISSLLNKYQNRISIEGAVYKPGVYAIQEDMTVEDLIKKAEGLKEDAYTDVAMIIRTKEDLTKEYINLNLKSSKDLSQKLKKEDIIMVSSIFDLKDQFFVSIDGAVRKPGNFAYVDSLTLKGLLLQAGGFSEAATGKGIEISRRKKNIDVNNPTASIVDLIKIDISTDLSSPSLNFKLQPFDIVSIKFDPFYKPQISVRIEGEVLIPGTYTLTSRVEKISDLISRAGNLLYTANVQGAKLKRKNIVDGNIIESVDKISKAAAKDSSGTIIQSEIKSIKEISIDLNEILSNPGSKYDILLEEGDLIEIPPINNLISISGEVYKPLDISYTEDKSLKSYLSDAGGITKYANKNKIFVIYPSGKAAATKKVMLFFRKYPKVTAGTKILIPRVPEKKSTDLAKAGLIISGLSALVTTMAIIYQITK